MRSDSRTEVMAVNACEKNFAPPNYHVTGNLYITVIIFPRIHFGITLHSLYRKNLKSFG